jgi:hypothetical protein
MEMLENRLVPAVSILNPNLLKITPIWIPGTQSWFQANMTDPGVESLAAGDFAKHGALTRADILGIFGEVESKGAVTSSELHDLNFLVNNSSVLHMGADTTFEATQVTNSYTAGLTIANAKGLIIRIPPTSVSQQVGLVDKWLLGFDHPTAGASYVNVNGGLFANGTPYYTDVRQGTVGDCWLLASLAEVAAREPGVIQNMFTYDGTAVENGVTVNIWSVRFFQNGVAKYVTVDSELPSSGSLYDHVPADGALWVTLAEKAYAEANGDGFVTTGNLLSDSYSALNGGWPSWALPAITGHSAAEYSVNPTNIVSAWNAGELIVLCTSSPVSKQIVGSHCYALVNYTPSAGDPFEIYNPWGTTSTGYAPYTENGNQVYGLFICNAPFISQNFSKQSISSGAPVEGLNTDASHRLGHDSVLEQDRLFANEQALAEFLALEALTSQHHDALFV